jgi:hypothetical protein
MERMIRQPPDITHSAAARIVMRLFRGRFWLKFGPLLLSLLLVTLSWCAVHGRWTGEAWSTPVAYGGDSWWGLAYAKALAVGEIAPILPKHPQSLGAPFEANWSDYPSVEEAVAAFVGLLARMLGLFPGTNLALLTAAWLSAGTFYYVCRQLRYERWLSAGASILYSLSPYAFWRGFSHLGLTFYWHLPLGLLVGAWCIARGPLTRRKWLAGIAVAVIYGTQNPYYTGLFLQFLVWTSLLLLIQRRRWSRVLAPLALCLVVFATFWLMNVDTFYNNRVNGPNTAIVNRSYQEVERYALKPVELLLPGYHRLQSVQAWGQKMYFKRALFLGEAGSAYLGLVGIIALGTLAWNVLQSIARPPIHSVPPHFFLHSLDRAVLGCGRRQRRDRNFWDGALPRNQPLFNRHLDGAAPVPRAGTNPPVAPMEDAGDGGTRDRYGCHRALGSIAATDLRSRIRQDPSAR